MHLAINNVHLYTLASSPRTWQWTRGGGAYCVVRLATEAGDIRIWAAQCKDSRIPWQVYNIVII